MSDSINHIVRGNNDGTLWNLAARYSQPGVSQSARMQQIKDANPQLRGPDNKWLLDKGTVVRIPMAKVPAVPPSAAPAPIDEVKHDCAHQAPSCCIDRIEVSCAHHSGARKLVVECAKARENQSLIFQAVIDKTGPEVSDNFDISVRVEKALCAQHAPTMFVVSDRSGRQVHRASKARDKIRLISNFDSSLADVSSLRTALKLLLLLFRSSASQAELIATRYTVRHTSCYHASLPDITIEVFPALKWEFEFGLIFSWVKKADVSTPSSMRANADSEIKLSFAASATHKLVTTSSKFSLGDTDSKEVQWVHLLLKMFKFLRKIVYWAGNIEVTFPEITFKYTSSGSHEESPAAPRLADNAKGVFEYSVGGSIKVSLFDLVLNLAAAAVGTAGAVFTAGGSFVVSKGLVEAIKKFRKVAKQGIGKKETVRVSAEGDPYIEIGGSLGLKADWPKPEDTLGEGTGSISLTLGVEVSLKGEARGIERVSMGASGKGTGTVTNTLKVKKSKKRPGRNVITGEIKFDGLKVNLTVWFKFNIVKEFKLEEEASFEIVGESFLRSESDIMEI